MCLFFETIRLENGVFANLSRHAERMNRTRRRFFGSAEEIDLVAALHAPDDFGRGRVKCRVEYDRTIRKIEFAPYVVRPIRTLQLVHADDISYAFKYADRSCFEKLKRGSSTDEILIVQYGRIADTSFSNIVFFDGQRWATPSTPLLAGTKRSELLEKGLIYEREIRPADLERFVKARLINAMLDIEDGKDLSLPQVIVD
jgi:4-amino-4-deoxychorismate lyase